MALSRHDRKVVDWDIKPQYKKMSLLHHEILATESVVRVSASKAVGVGFLPCLTKSIENGTNGHLAWLSAS